MLKMNDRLPKNNLSFDAPVKENLAKSNDPNVVSE